MMSEVKDPSQDHSQPQQHQQQQQQQQEHPPPPQPPPNIHTQHTTTTLLPMQAAATAQPIVPQGSPQVGQQQAVPQAAMTQVMQQGPQPAHSPHGVATSMPPQSPQFYVQASLASGMQPAPPAIAPAPGPQTSTTTVSALHQPLQHHLAPQTLTHPGVTPSPMPQFSPQVQVIQGGIPGGPYLQQLYQNAQGQLIMPSNLTLQTATGMNATPIQPNTLNGLNQPIQVIAATGKPFQGQIAPHMLTTATGKAGVLQAGGQAGYSPAAIPTTGSQTLVIGQLPVGVISSQQHNILPAHSTHKSTDMQKQQGISWATPGLHPPALLAQNQPIFIRGGQPGQDNVFISNPQPQTMHVPNSMMPPLQSMQQGPQAQKPRSGMEMPANIQPKAPNMRPAILPSNPAQIRPGASVSTQTAGQQLAPGHMSAPRAQNKMRGKSGANRTSPAIAGTAQLAAAQAPQTAVAAAATTTAVAVNTGTQVMQQQQQQAAVTPVSIPNPATTMSAPNKMISQAAPMQAITSMAQAKPGVPMTPPTAPLPPAGQPPPSLPQLVRAPAPPKSQQQATVNVTAIPQVSVAPSPPALIPSTAMQAVTHVQPLTTQAPISTPAPILAPASMPPPQVTCTVSQVSSPLQPPSLVPAMAPVTTTPSTVLAKQEIKTEANPTPKKVSPVIPITTPAPTPVSSTTTPVSQAPPQQMPPTLSAVNGTPPSSESGEVNDKTPPPTVNGTAHPVAPQPPSAGLPKAVVKPVLTHVIEGFVIHEASEPFPVSRSSLLTEIPKPRPPNYTNTIPVAAVTSGPTSIGGQAEKENLPDDEATRKKASDLTSTSPKLDTIKCEFCGKTDLRSKFKRSKRFCSTSCAKRYNVGCTKRIGLFKNPEEPPSKRLCEDESLDETDTAPQTEATEPQEMEGIETEEMVDEDSSAAPESPTKSQRVDILKWTVKDVVDFIQNLPGCKEYAEDFALQEIDGQALMLLKADHLMSAMSMKLGPALKICAKIESMRGDRKET